MRQVTKILYQLFIICLFVGTLPLFSLISFSIFVCSGFPVIFRQVRIGQNGKPFILYKFRTMYKDAHKHQESLRIKNETKGPVFKIRDDPRFTPFGRFLSHVGLDELPQLYNVLKGDLSLIGPRPLPVREVDKLTTWQKKRHLIKPGIISPWILAGYHDLPFDQWMKSDIDYTKNKSFWYDLRLCIRVIKFIFRLWAVEIKAIFFK